MKTYECNSEQCELREYLGFHSKRVVLLGNRRMGDGIFSAVDEELAEATSHLLAPNVAPSLVGKLCMPAPDLISFPQPAKTAAFSMKACSLSC